MNTTRLSITCVLALICTTGTARANDTLTLDNFRTFSVFHQTIDAERVDRDLLEAAVFLVTNEQRRDYGLSLLPHHARLADTARGHAQRMARHGFFDHADPTSDAHATPMSRARLAGITNPAVAENIYDFIGLQYNGNAVYQLPGQGQFSYSHDGPAIPMHTYLTFADDIVAGWMASPGHRANILHEDARQLGVGIEFYWNDNWPYFKAAQVFQLFHDALPAAEKGETSQAPRPNAPDQPHPTETELPPEDTDDAQDVEGSEDSGNRDELMPTDDAEDSDSDDPYGDDSDSGSDSDEYPADDRSDRPDDNDAVPLPRCPNRP